MGIKSLMKLLEEEAPECFKETEKSTYMGRTIAIDASMQLYQFMVQVRTQQQGGIAMNLTNEEGEVTSHLQGFLSRTISLMEKGLKPMFVFDGKPPELKLQELAKRRAVKEKAQAEMEAAQERLKEGKTANETEEKTEAEAIDDINKAMKRSVRVTKEHNEGVQKLLTLMGIPIVLAPGEAEAQCAELNKKDVVYAVGTEDMDTLTFGCKILLRRLTVPDSKKLPIREIHQDKVLSILGLSKEQFTDLCILMGCDFAPTIKGIGRKTAYKLVKEHGSLENVLASLDKKKYTVPDVMEKHLDEIRKIFNEPEVIDGKDIKLDWKPTDEEGLHNFLVKENGFDETRVKNALERLRKAKKNSSQKRMDSFFTVKSSSSSGNVGFKRPPGGKNDKGKKGKAKRGRGRGRR